MAINIPVIYPVIPGTANAILESNGATGDVGLALPSGGYYYVVVLIKVNSTTGTPTSYSFDISGATSSGGANAVRLAKIAPGDASAPATYMAEGFIDDTAKTYLFVDVTLSGGSSPTINYDVKAFVYRCG